MDDKLISKINEQINIVDLVSEFVPLEKKGKNYMGLCPFHNEKSPSFSVSPEKNIAVCMSCKEGGAPLTFYRKIKNISFQEAVADLALRLGITVSNEPKKIDPNEHLYKIMHDANQFFQFSLHNTHQGEHALSYLENRKIEKDLIEHFQIGWAPKEKDALYQLLKDKAYEVSDMIALGLVKQNDDGDYYDLFRSRLIFPITNPQGKVVGFSGRTLEKAEKVKYMNSPETPVFKKGEILYQYNESLSEIRKTKKVILYEGFFDCIASYKAGIKNIVATMGTALTKEQSNLLKKVASEVIIAYDGDNAGQSSAIKGTDILQRANLKVNILNIPEKLDPDDYLKKYGIDAYRNLFNYNVKDPFAFKYDKAISDKNLHNSNDVKELKDELETIFRYADNSIKKLYQNKALKELGININVNLSSFNDAPLIVRPKEELKLSDKYQWIEIELIAEILRGPHYLSFILEKLNFYELSDWMMTPLIEKIGEMYRTYFAGEIDIDNFIKLYPEFDPLIKKVTHHFVWENNKRIETQEKMNEYIQMINEDLHREKEIRDLELQLDIGKSKEEEAKILERILFLQQEKQKVESKRRV